MDTVQKHTRLRLWKCVQIRNPTDDVTLINNAFMLQKTGFMPQMYQEDTDTFSAVSFYLLLE